MGKLRASQSCCIWLRLCVFLYMFTVALQTRIEGCAARPRLCSARDEDLALVRGLLHVAIDVLVRVLLQVALDE